jgi:hypothetical protein
MYKALINQIAQQELLEPFRVMGATIFHFLKLEPALPYGECSIIGLYVDVKGDKRCSASFR